MKRCAKCGEVKPLAEFPLAYGKPRSPCRACDRAYRRAFRVLHGARLNAASRQWYADNKQRVAPRNVQRARASKLRRKYELTTAQYDTLVQAQAGCCAICGKQQHDRRLYIDHDHDTGKVRGLLCMRCNSALGFFDDSLETITAAVAYLKLHLI